MVKINKNVIAVIIVGFLTAIAVTLYMYNKPHRDIKNEDSLIIRAEELTSAYFQDETSSNKRFLDKAVQVTGVIVGLENDPDGKTIVVLKGDTPETTVRCTFVESLQVKTGETLTLKGRCTGYLSDVIIIDCLPIKTENENE